MRAKRVLLSAEILPDFFKDRGLVQVTNPLPEDAKLLRFDYDNRMDCFVLIFESSKWEEVIEGCALCEFTPEFKRYDINILDDIELKSFSLTKNPPKGCELNKFALSEESKCEVSE